MGGTWSSVQSRTSGSLPGELAVKDFAGHHTGVFSVVDYRLPFDNNVCYPLGILMRVFKSCSVGDFPRVKDYQVGDGAGGGGKASRDNQLGGIGDRQYDHRHF